MKVKRFEWKGVAETWRAVRCWEIEQRAGHIDEDFEERMDRIEAAIRDSDDRDRALLALSAALDATERPRLSLRVEEAELKAALAALDAGIRESLELAASNIRAVAEAQLDRDPQGIELPQGQTVTVRQVPVESAGIYAPGGRAAYPSSVLMCAIPAQVAGVERVAMTTPPGPDGKVNPIVLAAASLCGIEEVYAVGGAQAIFALAYGTETIDQVDVIAGPGSVWVREAKSRVSDIVGIDSLAGPSELMVIAGHDANAEWIALDLCAQAEHGEESPLLVVAVEEHVLDAIETAAVEAAASRSSVRDASLALIQVPDAEAGVDLANAYAPEHLELIEEDAALLADKVTTAGCVFVGRYGATAFGDYVAGSNHVLPTGRAGRFSGPLGPSVFRRRISTVEVSAEAAAKLAPHVDTLARAEGFPVHAESAMIRAES
ncbi:MAG: histidinol dehydrogenase [Solirubrobacterales bacterium]|jgi:histidinol dehydrogenase|nr:histidinol dehydrogenase [Solirubrobacterales bacterium]